MLGSKNDSYQEEPFKSPRIESNIPIQPPEIKKMNVPDIELDDIDKYPF